MKNTAKTFFILLGLLAGAAGAATDTYTASGTWTAPAGVTSVTVEAWGAGGAGGGATGNPAKGGGGAGGQYARKVVTVVPGNNYAIVVGAARTGGTGDGQAGGDSTFAATTVVAKGGAGGTGAVNGVAGTGSVAGGVGDVVYAGGSGSNGATGGGNCNNGGAGGGGAGSGGTGGSAAGNTAGTGTATGGGAGGAGRNNSGTGNAGSAAGGGGGGACAESGADQNGGNSAAGMVAVTYPLAPSATTNAASALTVSGATLNGTVSSNGAITTVTFNYGLTAAYGGMVVATGSPLAANATNTAVSAAVTGLTCNTLYHFRVKAVSSDGTTDGNDLTFTTSACVPPNVTTDPATSLTTTGASLNGTVNDNGASTTVTFDYGLTVAYGSTVTATQSPLAAGTGSSGVSATVSGLSCNTTYHYRAVGVNATGTTNGGDQTFTTLACPSGISVTASPGACVDDAGVGTVAWAALDAIASDDSYATATLGDNAQSHYLKCTNYGFAIPAGATINGITVNVERNASATNSPVQDLRMRIVKAGVIGATDRSTTTQYPNTDTIEAHGNAADLWGTAWTVADINSTTFGAALAAYKNGTNGGNRTVNVDHMPITVNYTPSAPWVASIDRTSPNPTAAGTSVSWDVLFSASVTGVDISDFVLIQGGSATGASITSVTGSGMVWTVTANTGTGALGTLGLNLVDDDTIAAGGIPLGGAGISNGNFTGQVYTLEIPVCNASMIFCDDFERANPGAVGNGWTVTPGPTGNCTGQVGNIGCAGIDTDIPPFNATTNRANSTRSLFTRWSTVSVDSRAIDLSSYPSALVNFWIRRGSDSFSEYPEGTGEDYLVEYLDDTGNWKILAQYPTGVLEGEVFAPTIQLPADAMHANFKLRFYQPTGNGCCGQGGAPGVIGYDYWHIDDVIITEAPESSYVGAFCDTFEAGFGRWNVSAEGAPPTAAIGVADLGTTDFNSSTHEVDMRWGYVVISTLRTDMTGVNGNITYWVKSGTTAARDPDASEDLVVEYRNSSGNWVALTTYPGTDAAGTVYNGSHVMPADAQHTGFRLRFRMLNGSNFDNDYWHVDDVCVGMTLPNTDLAIAKTRGGPLVPGSNAAYTLTVSNNGPNTLSGSIQVVDTLPAGLTFYSAGGTGWTCSSNAPNVTCSYVGTLNNGASAPPITLIVAVDAGASGTIVNTATVNGTATDGTPGNNTASDTYSIQPGFAFTDSVCVNGIAFGAPGQTCNLIDWSAALTAGLNKTGIYITAKNAAGIPTRLSAVGATNVSMQYGLSCYNPAANAGVQATFTATGSALPLCEANGAVPTSWTAGVNLSFPANIPSVGPFIFNYADVGQIELHMRNSAVTTQTGSSGAFVVKPAGFVLSAIKCTTADAANCGAGALPSGNNPGAANAAGPTFIRAGFPFSVTVTAVNSLGNATPNYGKETPSAESVKLTPSNVVAGMVAAPAVSGSFGAFVAGVATGTAFTWSEAGIITLTPGVGDGDYLGKGDVTGTISGNVGRFYPDHFDTAVILASNVPMTCPTGLTCPAAYPGFVYSGQTFSLTVTARNASGITTANYNTTTGFAKTTALTPWGTLGTITPPSGAGTLGVTSVSAFAAGTLTEANQNYTFATALTSPTDLYVRAIDTDSVSSLRAIPANSVEGGVKVVSGRIKVSNAYGSEKLPLTLTATAQYYNTNGWVNSTTDSVTSLTVAGSYTVGAGSSAVTLTPGTGILSNGMLTINLGAPSGGAMGVATVDPTAPGYLPVIPGTATFGLYKGGDRFIYQRENY